MTMQNDDDYYVYHVAPLKFCGDILMPLNVLQHDYPDVYNAEKQKYVGREGLRKVRISPLDCEWSDVIMFSFVHPQVIVDEYRGTGKIARSPMEWFRIKLSKLDPEESTVFLYERDFSTDLQLQETDFKKFVPELYPKLTEFREVTREYYRSKERPLLFFRLPHLLFKGTIHRSALESIYTV